MQEGWLRNQKCTQSEASAVAYLRSTTRLHEGEAESIAMAVGRNALVLADDEARRIAHALGVKRIGTAGVLLEAYLRQYLTISELEDAITDLANVSWQSPEVATLILKRARETQQ